MDNIYKYLVNYKRSGEKKWFDKIYYHFLPKIYNYFYFNTFDTHISEDLASEVFFKIYKNIKDTKLNSRTLNSWIYKIAKNHLIDYFRKKKIYTDNILLTDNYDDINDDKLIDTDFFIKNSILLRKEFSFENQKLIKAMDRLTLLQKNIIILIFIMDLDYKTIADILMKKESTVRGILFRALNILKSEIDYD